MSSRNRSLQKKLNKMNRQINTDETIIDWTKSISAGDEQFIKMMFGEMFPELLEMSNAQLVKFCKDNYIYSDTDFYNFIADYNTQQDNAKHFEWLKKGLEWE